MSEPRVLARVILRSDGHVHIAFRDIRSIYATIKNLQEFFSDPFEFIEVTSHSYEDSTFQINRRGKRIGFKSFESKTTLYYIPGTTC